MKDGCAKRAKVHCYSNISWDRQIYKLRLFCWYSACFENSLFLDEALFFLYQAKKSVSWLSSVTFSAFLACSRRTRLSTSTGMKFIHESGTQNIYPTLTRDHNPSAPGSRKATLPWTERMPLTFWRSNQTLLNMLLTSQEQTRTRRHTASTGYTYTLRTS